MTDPNPTSRVLRHPASNAVVALHLTCCAVNRQHLDSYTPTQHLQSLSSCTLGDLVSLTVAPRISEIVRLSCRSTTRRRWSRSQRRSDEKTTRSTPTTRSSRSSPSSSPISFSRSPPTSTASLNKSACWGPNERRSVGASGYKTWSKKPVMVSKRLGRASSELLDGPI